GRHASGAELARALPLDRPAGRAARAVRHEDVQDRMRVTKLKLRHLPFDLDRLVGPIDGRERVMRGRRKRRQRGEANTEERRNPYHPSHLSALRTMSACMHSEITRQKR